jgi:hypothetical protein
LSFDGEMEAYLAGLQIVQVRIVAMEGSVGFVVDGLVVSWQLSQNEIEPKKRCEPDVCAAAKRPLNKA